MYWIKLFISKIEVAVGVLQNANLFREMVLSITLQVESIERAYNDR